ncbi:hypothetical protein NQ314_003428 [Rhamnusium bicolor]|uniref:Uncharacterized protein n=1 Tax=Rhamnusium bicolor TaxID=1586634 RepID=A0AAV8ZP03_9CUCU|nr:hypothetical protein NQ314_003428 [Rhamnusium bicolor]
MVKQTPFTLDDLGVAELPEEVLNAANEALKNLIPEKSKDEKAYNAFKQWQGWKLIEIFNKNVLLAYLLQLTQNVGNEVKKAKILSDDELKRFLLEARDKIYLLAKVVAVFGLFGALATILANTGANAIKLKRLGGWKSSSIADSYVDESVENKIKLAKKMFGNGESGTSNSTVQVGIIYDKNTTEVMHEILLHMWRLQRYLSQELRSLV